MWNHHAFFATGRNKRENNRRWHGPKKIRKGSSVAAFGKKMSDPSKVVKTRPEQRARAASKRMCAFISAAFAI